MKYFPDQSIKKNILFNFEKRSTGRAVPVRRCGMTVMQMLFTIWIGLDYLTSVLSHGKPSSLNSLDLRTP